MGSGRWLKKAPFDGAPKHPDGRRACRWCGEPVDPPRRKWCSQECIDQFMIRRSFGEVRSQVFRRDKGICAVCGFDCRHLEKTIQSKRWESRSGWQRAWDEAEALGFQRNISLWQADHIVPVSEGGGACGLENYRTLCVPCHRKATKKLACRLADKRKLKR